MNILKAVVFAFGTAMLPAAAHAVIVFGSQGRNTAAPTGALADSGWQFQGTWGAFLGTPIAPQAFITAQHIGGSIGNTFTYLSQNYTTTSFTDHPGTDLRVWKVSGTFPSYAPLYTKNDEATQSLVVFGRGTTRGAVLTVSGQDKGWRWGTIDGAQSWGTNTVTGIATSNTVGQLLAYDFSSTAGNDEGILSDHDSAGGVFIKDGGTWKLAGINYGVSGPYKLSASDPASFNASLYDQSGLFRNDGSSAPAGPGFSYSSRISSNVNWMSSAVPEPTSLMLLGGVGLLMIKRRRR